MKKIIFGLLSFLLISPLFVNGDILGIVDIVDSTGENIYYELTDMCHQYSSATPKNLISYGFGKYTSLDGFSYYNINGDSVSAVDPCTITDNPGVYVYGLNNGYYTDSSGNNILLGSVVNTGLSYYPFTFSFNFSYGLNFSSVFNGNFYLYLPVSNNRVYRNPYYITINGNNNNSSLVSLNNGDFYSLYRFSRLFTRYNIYNFWDSSKFITNFGSVNDLSDGCTRIMFSVLSDGGYTSILNCSGNLQFKTIAGSDINYTFYDDFSSVDIINNNRDYLFLHFNDYTSDYLSGKLTIILKNTNSGIVYNIYPFVNSVNQLSGVDPLRKGYMNGNFYSYDLNYSIDLPYYFDSYGSYNNGLNIRSYNRGRYYFSSSLGYIYPYISSTSTLTFSEDNSVPKINLIGDNGSNSLTTGKVVDVLDTLCKSSLIKPAFCNGVTEVSTGVDGFWDLDGSGNLIYTLINTDPNNMGWADITSNGSGGFNIICADQDGFGCPLLENAGLSGYLDYGSGFILGTDYYETFFQKTGRFFACPYGYVVLDTNSFLKVLNKFNQISESIGFDFMLPINCSIAAFTHGKNYKFLKDVDLGLNPLMGQIQGPDDPRVYLYRFFDFLMSIALLFFLLKLYHLIF